MLFRSLRRRYLILAICATILLIYTIAELSFSAEWSDASLEEPKASLSSVTASPTKHLPEITAPSSERSSCSLTKLSKLHGAHEPIQLEAALESHRRHSERWGCGFEVLAQDLTGRKPRVQQVLLHLVDAAPRACEAHQEMREWLLWIDADSIVVNPAIFPCTFLPPDVLSNIFTLVTADDQVLGNGTFFLRIHQSSVDLLQAIDYPFVHPGGDLGSIGAAVSARPKRQQSTAMEAAAKARSSAISPQHTMLRQ